MKRYKNTQYFYKMESTGRSVYVREDNHYTLIAQVGKYSEIGEFIRAREI